MEKVKESLAGRCIIMEIYPLTLPELMTTSFKDAANRSFFAKYVAGEQNIDTLYPVFTLDPQYVPKKNAYDFYLRYGGYPAITDAQLTDAERDEWLEMYVKTFLERDIRDLVSFRDLEPFVKLQRYLAHTTGELANYSSIAKETGVSVPTVQRYVQYMEISYQSVALPAWFANPVKKLVKSPKIHFLDNGVNHTDARHLRNLQSILNKPIKQSFILSNDMQMHDLDDNVTAMHAAAFLC